MPVVSSCLQVSPRPRRVALFVTCLVDLFRPSVGFAAVKLLEDAGCTVEVPPLQVCCGQPAYNSGDRADDARHRRARSSTPSRASTPWSAPSGSCGGMLTHHYPGLFDDDPAMKARAEDLAGRSYELMAFLVDVLGVTTVAARYDGVVTYHDSCSGLRELGVKQQPRRLLAIGRRACGCARCRRRKSAAASAAPSASNIRKSPTPWSARRSADIAAAGADTLLAGDLGCLMNMAGKLQRAGQRGARCAMSPKCWPAWRDAPPIGEPEASSADAIDRPRLQATMSTRALADPQPAGFARPS